MELTFTTPALLFSTVSLLMVAYTNRFMGLAGLIRSLHDSKETSHLGREKIHTQILMLKKRVKVIKNMQFFGVLALVFSIISIAAIYFGLKMVSEYSFLLALVLLMLSLILSLVEIKQSTEALKVLLDECEGDECSYK